MSVVEVERIPLAELVQLAHRVTAELGIRSQSKHTRSPGMEAPPYPRSITGSASGLVSAAHGHALEYPGSSSQAASQHTLRAASPSGSKRSLAVIDALPLQLAISLLEMWDVLVWPVVPLAFMRQAQLVTLLQRLHSPQDHLSSFDTHRLDVACALLLALHAAQLASALPSQRAIAQGRVYKALFEAAVQRGHPLKSEDAEPWLDAQWVGKRAHEVLQGEAEGRVGALKDYVKVSLKHGSERKPSQLTRLFTFRPTCTRLMALTSLVSCILFRITLHAILTQALPLPTSTHQAHQSSRRSRCTRLDPRRYGQLERYGHLSYR